MERATRVASTVGMIIGYLMIAGGIVLAFEDVVSGIWLVAIGWFLRSAAMQAYQQVTLERAFGGVRVANIMNPTPITVRPDVTLDDLVSDYIFGRNVRGLPVVGPDGRLLGLITVSDIREVPRDEWGFRTVRDVMTPREALVSVTPEANLAEALRAMSERDLHQLPVVRDHELAGLLTRNALIRFMQSRQELPPVEPAVSPRRRPLLGRGGTPSRV
jgi:CBS domain-containing protein